MVDGSGEGAVSGDGEAGDFAQGKVKLGAGIELIQKIHIRTWPAFLHYEGFCFDIWVGVFTAGRMVTLAIDVRNFFHVWE